MPMVDGAAPVPDAPASDVTKRGAATAISDSTPAAIRAATLSVRTASTGAETWPRRTWATTDRVSCAQQASQATHATSVTPVKATRATSPH